MFDQATRIKLRFETTRGMLSVEDIWDLPLTSGTGKVNLDDIAKELYKAIKESDDTISFVTDTVKTNSLLQLKFDIVRHVISVRKDENAARAKEQSVAEQRQKIMAAIVDKQDSTLKEASLEDLNKMLQNLG